MDQVKQFFIDNPGSQEYWYDETGNVIHYSHPLFTNHITRDQSKSLSLPVPESKKKIAEQTKDATNI